MAQSMPMLNVQRCSIELERVSEAGEIELMAQAVVDIAPADWARFEAMVNEPRSYTPALA